MSVLSKDQILSAADSKPLKLDVPEWGGHVFLKNMSGSERDQFEAETYIIRGKNVEVNRHNMRARLLVRTLCDEAGTLLFTLKDVEALGRKSGRAVDRCYAEAQKVNGLTEQDVEDLTKN